MRLLCTLALAANLFWLTTVAAADAPNADEQAIHAAIDSFVVAFNSGNATAVADHWLENGEYVLPSGEHLQNRDAIREHFATVFAGSAKPRIQQLTADVKLITKEVALEEGTVRVTTAGRHEDASYIAVHVKRGKTWKLNTIFEAAPQPTEPDLSSHEHLQQLAWLVGTWTEQSAHGEVSSSFHWSKNGTFISGIFRLPLPTGDVLEGTQIIGWDPEARVIRSWMFDSHGGFGEGLWSRGAKHWSVKFVQVLPDGRRSASTNIYDVVDDHTFVWKTVGRKIDGQFAPNLGPITAVRSATDSE